MEWSSYKPLEGRLVEIHSLPTLEPNAETQANEPGLGFADFNGHQGRCLRWDESEQKYVVHTFEGVVIGVPESCLNELELTPVVDGGFDAVWPSAGMGDDYSLAEATAEALSERGYCVVQMFAGDRLRSRALQEAMDTPRFDSLKAEMEEAYLGTKHTTQCGVLEVSGPDSIVDGALSYCDRDLTTMGVLVSPVLEDVFGIQVEDRSNALVRTPCDSGQAEKLAELDEQDLVDQVVESFVGWVLRRKLCLMYFIENEGGVLELMPKPHLGQPPVKLPIRRCRMVLFRHDVMGYSYRPEGASVAIQAWLLEPPKCVEFRQMPLPPGIQGIDRIHVASATERFPANCMGCDMTFALFVAGTDAETPVPVTRFDCDLYWDPGNRDAPLIGKAYTMHGSFVNDEDLYGFDNGFFGFSDEESMFMSPAQRWILETGYDCLQKGGWTRSTLNGQRIGTFMGDSGSEWNQTFFGTGPLAYHCNKDAVTISRLAYIMGMRGPTLSVDTACSASLVALNAGAHMMRRFTYRTGDAKTIMYNESPPLDKALCMGILVMVHPSAWIGECAATMLSPRGRCFTFDQTADGFIRGEGCCAVHLRSEHDEAAQEILSLAVVVGSCANQDGKSASLTAPHGPSQSDCIRQCLREGGTRPQDVMIGECHGTGTSLGDPIEVGAVRAVMVHHREDGPHTHCTAKAHVGHEEANAGVCGFIKIVLMLNAATITPNPHIHSLNAHLDTKGYPILFNSELRATMLADQIAGVSSFGFGGTNSRADCWSDPELGTGKGGSRTLLSRDEAVEWIGRILDNSGTAKEGRGFVPDHKPGH